MSWRLDEKTLRALTDLRVDDDGALLEHARSRRRRQRPTQDGRLVILAADHPARMVTEVGNDPLGMSDRGEYLGRVVRVLRSGHVDGLMGTPDVIEEALAVDLLGCRAGEASFLAEKLLIGSMNRGGLAGTVFEMDDRFTAFTADQIAAMNMDGAKMMFRLEPLEWASGRTIAACAQAINECLESGLMVFLEPLMVRYENGHYVPDRSPEALAKVCGVASALGKSSWKTWLKLPFTVEYSVVARATSCPILMLGGPATGDPAGLLQDFSTGLTAAPNVRGALVGRNVLYPGEADPAAVAAAVWGLVHEGISLREALARCESAGPG